MMATVISHKQQTRTTKTNTIKATMTSTQITSSSSSSMEALVITMRRELESEINFVLRLYCTVATTMPTPIIHISKMEDTTRVATRVTKMNTTTNNTTTKVHQLQVSNLNTGKRATGS